PQLRSSFARPPGRKGNIMAVLSRNNVSVADRHRVPRSKRSSRAQSRLRTRPRPIGRPPLQLSNPSEANDAGSNPRGGLDFSGLAVFERLFLRTPVRLLRAANNVLDLMFYDIHTIPAEKRRELLRWSDPDGSILVVHPGDGDRREVEHFEHV